MPRVSVVIPTYNCAKFLGRTIDSALRQTYRDFEIIVVDDGSTDGTQALVAAYEESVRYVYQTNQGASAARNAALSRASGEFIAYLDADDLWRPDKLSRQEESRGDSRLRSERMTDGTILLRSWPGPNVMKGVRTTVGA